MRKYSEPSKELGSTIQNNTWDVAANTIKPKKTKIVKLDLNADPMEIYELIKQKAQRFDDLLPFIEYVESWWYEIAFPEKKAICDRLKLNTAKLAILFARIRAAFATEANLIAGDWIIVPIEDIPNDPTIWDKSWISEEIISERLSMEVEIIQKRENDSKDRETALQKKATKERIKKAIGAIEEEIGKWNIEDANRQLISLQEEFPKDRVIKQFRTKVSRLMKPWK